MAGLSAVWIGLGVASSVAIVIALRWCFLPPEDRGFLTLRRWLASVIRSRFGGYEHRFNEPDESKPLSLAAPKRVLVIGGGLAGISTAANLAERGFDVTLREKEPYLGGKVGAWTEDVDGEQLDIEHGFHAFFRHYYNLNRFLDRTGIRQHMRSIDDYMILESDGRTWSFRDVETSPVLNLVALARGGLYRFRDILFTPARDKMGVFLEYDRDHTFAELDGVSYGRFADDAHLPRALRMVFNTFARAFFADEQRMSMAELVKSFHFYYLSHDHGLLYDYPEGDYRTSVIEPITAHLQNHGVEIQLGRGVSRIERSPENAGLGVDGESFDYVVLATSSLGARQIADASPDLRRVGRTLRALRPSQRYAVLRVWTDRDIRRDIPVFVATDRQVLLDSVTVCHRISDSASAWVGEHGGGVYELHCYAVPDEVRDDEVERLMLAELGVFFEELQGCRIAHRHLQLRADFTAFHVGMAADRPKTDAAVPGLYLAGDWVRLPIPAMLMEGAYASGLLCANAILAREGLREHAVYTVPTRGLLAGLKPRVSVTSLGGHDEPSEDAPFVSPRTTSTE